jgi:hypothetical protein
MKQSARFVIALAIGAGRAAPPSARLRGDDLPSTCRSEIGMMCGAMVSTALCVGYRGNRLSEQCQRAVISRIEVAAVRVRKERAKPDAAAGARPRLSGAPSPDSSCEGFGAQLRWEGRTLPRLMEPQAP